jgi:hypothetical protein
MGYGGTERRSDAEQRAIIDVELMLANVEAAFGDYQEAWRHLDAAEDLSGGALAGRCLAIRQSWYDREAGLDAKQ